MSTITLTEDYGYTSYTINGLSSGSTIDASGATWIQDNDSSDGNSNPYPVLVYDAPDLVLEGGTIFGNIDLTGERNDIYDLGNSAGIRTEDAPNIIIRDWRIMDTWDAITVSWNSPDFLIEDVWVTNVRDDSIQNDRLQSGTIRDSLFDGVFAGLSIDPSSSSPVDGHNEVVTLDGVLMRLQLSLYNGEMTHHSFIKTDSATDGAVTPSLRFINNVIAIEDVDHRSYRSMFDAWDHTIESSGNYYLNLSDTPLPSDYPMPPAGWTVLQGQEARDYWEAARDGWIADHADGSSPPPVVEEDVPPPVVEEDVPPPVVEEDVPPPPVEEDVPPPVDEDVPGPSVDNVPPPPAGDGATFDGENFEGTKGADTIVGNALDNFIDGDNGDDTIKGGDGNDTIRGDDGADLLWGGDGEDNFFFKRLSDSREGRGDSRGIDTIMDFTKGEDKIDLSSIDADRKASGDQAFNLIDGALTKTAGELSVRYDAATDKTVITASVDHDLEAELTILLDGNVDLSEADFIL